MVLKKKGIENDSKNIIKIIPTTTPKSHKFTARTITEAPFKINTD
jgi:hypothetical protein